MRQCVRVEGVAQAPVERVAVGATGVVTPFGIARSFFLTIRHFVTFYLTGRRGPLGRAVWSIRSVICVPRIPQYTTAVDRGVRLTDKRVCAFLLPRLE